MIHVRPANMPILLEDKTKAGCFTVAVEWSGLMVPTVGTVGTNTPAPHVNALGYEGPCQKTVNNHCLRSDLISFIPTDLI